MSGKTIPSGNKKPCNALQEKTLKVIFVSLIEEIKRMFVVSNKLRVKSMENFSIAII